MGAADLGLPLPQPLYFGPSEAPLLGWFHAGKPSSRLAVLLCGPWGDEDLGTYRGLHELAERLARAGLPVLRFDQAGEGDSFDLAAGGDGDLDRWPHWLSATQAAADLVRELSGAPRVALLGVRLGALLAAHAAAARSDVAALIGLLPPTHGRAWVREARLLGARLGAVDAGDGWLQAGGFQLEPGTVKTVSTLDWPASARGTIVSRALLLERGDLPLPEAAVQRWRALAGQLDHQRRDDLDGVLAIAHSARLPAEVQAGLVEWLQAREAEVSDVAQVIEITPAFPVSVEAGSLQESVIRVDGGPVGGVLVGILSRLVSPKQPGAPALLLLSSGAERRIGPHRLWVPLARQRARQGGVVLRLDLAGLGDSPARPGEPEADVYDARCVQGIHAAVDWLRREQAVGSITVLGICSGAHHAWRAALAGLPVQAVVPVNPLVFHWNEGMSLDPTAHAFGQIAISLDAARAVRDPRRWLKLLRGRVAVRVILVALAGRLRASMAARVDRVLSHLGKGRRQDLGQELQAVVQRGVAVHFVFSDGDPGRALLMREAGDLFKRLSRDGHVHLTTIEQADHTFMQLTGRQNLFNRLHPLLDALTHGDPSATRAANARAITSS